MNNYKQYCYITRIMDDGYREYIDKCNRIPHYVLRKLKDMPNNMGYIHNGIWLFGEQKPSANRNVVMFEYLPDGVTTMIHEVSSFEHKIFKKIGKDPKTFVSVKKLNTKPPVDVSYKYNKMDFPPIH